MELLLLLLLLICAISIIILCAIAIYELQKAKNNLSEISKLCREAQDICSELKRSIVMKDGE